MLRQLLASVYILSAAAVIAAVVFSFPELTSGGTSDQAGVSQARLDAAVSAESDYCRKNVTDVNCQCFAQKSGLVQSYERSDYRGFSYLDQQDLARDQATDAC